MKLRRAFAASLNELRLKKQLTQEDFSLVSSRTYISMLERGERTPTIEKIEQLCKVLKVHPLTLLAMTFSKTRGRGDIRRLLELVASEIEKLRR